MAHTIHPPTCINWAYVKGCWLPQLPSTGCFSSSKTKQKNSKITNLLKLRDKQTITDLFTWFKRKIFLFKSIIQKLQTRSCCLETSIHVVLINPMGIIGLARNKWRNKWKEVSSRSIKLQLWSCYARALQGVAILIVDMLCSHYDRWHTDIIFTHNKEMDFKIA